MITLNAPYTGDKNGFVRADAVMQPDGSIVLSRPGHRSAVIKAEDIDVDIYRPLFDVVGKMPAIVTPDENDKTKSSVRLVPYCMLHNHSEYSLLDGMSTAPKIAKTLDSDEFTPVFALTDHGMMSGLPSFDAELRKHNEYPISGCEFYAQSLDGKMMNNHLILLIKNEIGYRNMCRLFTEAQTNFYRHANITVDMLTKYHEGLVCLTACIGGELPKYILNGDTQRIEEFITVYRDIFGDDLYFEVQNHELEKEDTVRAAMFDLSKKYGIKVVATTDSHYVSADDAYAHEVLLCISTKSYITDPVRRSSAGDDVEADSSALPADASPEDNTHRGKVSYRFAFDGTGYHILSAKEFYQRFCDHPEAITNAFEIMDKCAFRFSKKKIEMPLFEIPDGMDEETYFRKLTNDGFKKRFSGTPYENDRDYIERKEYELSVICQMGFIGYFLIVQDFINWAKNNNIAIGPGRGSAAGSLVAYCIGITDVNPIPYNLLFERFLNPERVSMPDIDVDISDEHRQEVIDYVSRKYGADHVSRIVTFGTEAAKQVCQDVARVLGFMPDFVKPLTDAIPTDPHMTLDKAMEQSADFKMLYDGNPDYRNIVAIAKRLEGIARNSSQHACGVVIARNPICDSVPELMMTDKETKTKTYTAAFNMVEIEDAGCIKFDFLGLRNVSVLKNACDSIGIDYTQIPLFDPAVYAYIGTGNTDGIFQIESAGMKKLCRDMFFDVKTRVRKCKTQDEKDMLGLEMYERLTAAISLYRPGPIDSIDDYISGMRNPEAIHYDAPQLKPILRATYGCIVYQEQVQQICRSLAGYSYGRADLIRRAMGKKKKAVMDAEREVFLHGNKAAYEAGKDKDYVPGCVANGVNEDSAVIIWDKMAKFAEYAFNKSHSAAYAYISVRTAWLKYYHPVNYWTATLNSVRNKSDKLAKYLNCARATNKLVPVEINGSELLYSAVANDIVLGFAGLRDMGKSALPIIAEREANGPFTSLSDFLIRCRPGKKVLESLAYSGAFTLLGVNRRTVAEQVEKLVAFAKEVNDNDSFADFPELNALYESTVREKPLPIDDIEEFPLADLLEQEKKYTGMYVTAHPTDAYKDAIAAMRLCNSIADYLPDDENTEISNAQSNKDRQARVVFAGVISSIEKKTTKKGDTMYSGVLEDKTGSIPFVLFPKSLQELQSRPDYDPLCLTAGSVVCVGGRVNGQSERDVQIVLDNIALLDKEPPVVRTPFYCETDKPSVQQLRAAALNCKSGNHIVVFKVNIGGNMKASVVIDAETGVMYSIRSRAIDDERNLAVDDNATLTLMNMSRSVS